MMVEPIIERFGRTDFQPEASVIVLNYNGAKWLAKCFESLNKQTAVGKLEIIFADNASSDASVAVAREWLSRFSAALLVHNGGNVGFCEGNNIPARYARGKYLFFLNPDTWLETECLERLIAETHRAGAGAATPWIQNYEDDSHQDLGFFGFDIFGLPSTSRPLQQPREVFIACGAACFLEAEIFRQVGMFDPEFFMYSDEVDLSWRVWIAGHRITAVPTAKVHHRGAADVNPAGGSKQSEFRTSDTKRFLTNRNSLLTLLKNGQHVVLLMLIPLIFLLLLETAVACVLVRRLSFARTTFWAALVDCWRLRDMCGQNASKRSQRSGSAGISGCYVSCNGGSTDGLKSDGCSNSEGRAWTRKFHISLIHTIGNLIWVLQSFLKFRPPVNPRGFLRGHHVGG